MKITNHWLVKEGSEKIFTDKKSPNFKDLTTVDKLPKDLIIHYTASGLSATINTFMSRNSTSVHLVIDRDGTIYQMVSFAKQAYHAGYSTWDNVGPFNGRSIGIELINMGWDVANVDSSDIVQIKHKHKFETHTKWHKYPDAQMQSLYTVTKLLLSTYQLNRILGHDDISAGRKQDPGPAFDWDKYRTTLFGHSNNIGKVFKVKSSANFRKGDGTNYEIIKSLDKNYEVGLIETWNNWSKVYLVNSSDEVTFKGSNGKIQNKKSIGWIRSDLIELK